MELLGSIKFTPSFNFIQDFRIKDASEHFVTTFKPELDLVLQDLKQFLPNRDFLTVDYFEQILLPGKTTCRDINWHVDGINNDYILVCWGEWRTEFLISPFTVKPLENVRLTNLKIQRDLAGKELSYLEVPQGIPVKYNSSQIHRGRRAESESKRVFLRLCSSDYLNPKNYLRR